MNLASFDIFDTALVRRCGRPDMIWRLMGAAIWPDDQAQAEAFYNWRACAEKGALATIESIYSSAEAGCFAPYSAEDLRQAEMKEGSCQLCVNPRVRTIIEKHRAKGDRIMFISDMYLPSDFLAGILRREGCLMGDEKVVVSCETGACKHQGGKLYAEVAKSDVARQIDGWVHYGDNQFSDVRYARKHGIKATHVSAPFTETEQRWMSMASSLRNGWQMSALAGIARNARLQFGDTPAVRMAADFVSPAYIPYVRFVIEEARRRGIKRLYFLNRDSYILLKIAEQIPHEGIELRYLYVSRRSLMVPYLRDCRDEDYIAIADRNNLVGRDSDHLLWQLQYTRQQMQEEYGVNLPFVRIVNASQQQQFMDTLFRHERFTPRFKERADRQFELIKEYFRQEGLLDEDKTAMVDVGWLGTSRLMINRLLKDCGGHPTTFFYMGVRRDVISPLEGDYVSYFQPGQLDTNATALIENYFSASPYPSTGAYARDTETGRIVPVFSDNGTKTDTPIIKANVGVAAAMTWQIINAGLDDSGIMFRWASDSLDTISHLKADDIDFTPLLEADVFDGNPTAKKLSLTELFKITFLGDQITIFEPGSLRLTVGKSLANLILKANRHSIRLRRYLYKLKTGFKGA